MPSCLDCKSKLEPVVSNSRSPNEYRIRLYSCKKCSVEKGRHVIIAVTRKIVPEDNIWELINQDIFEGSKK